MTITPTTNYGLSKIDFNTEIDAWAPPINANWDVVDTQLKINANTVGAAFTGDVVKPVGGTVLTISNDAVTNAKLANMPPSTIKGSIAGGDPVDLTGAEAAAIIGAISGGGGVSGSGVNTYTGSITLAIGDANDFLVMNNPANAVVTIPPNSSVPFAIGTEVTIGQQNTGNVTVVPGSGVTLLPDPDGAAISSQYGVIAVRKVAVNVWWAYAYDTVSSGGAP